MFVYWPAKDVLKHGDHWYECMLMCALFSPSKLGMNDLILIHLSLLVLFVLFQISSGAVWLGVRQLLSWRLFVTNYIVMLAIVMTVWTACYFLWVHMLVLPYPMPFIGLPGYLIALPTTNLILLFFCFPKSWMAIQSFKERRKYFVLVILYTQLIFFTYFALEWAFVEINKSYQWILAVTLPLIREGHTFAFGLITSKSAGVEVKTLKKY